MLKIVEMLTMLGLDILFRIMVKYLAEKNQTYRIRESSQLLLEIINGRMKNAP